MSGQVRDLCMYVACLASVFVPALSGLTIMLHLPRDREQEGHGSL